jgi:hypothetical protein
VTGSPPAGRIDARPHGYAMKNADDALEANLVADA